MKVKKTLRKLHLKRESLYALEFAAVAGGVDVTLVHTGGCACHNTSPTCVDCTLVFTVCSPTCRGC